MVTPPKSGIEREEEAMGEETVITLFPFSLLSCCILNNDVEDGSLLHNHAMKGLLENSSWNQVSVGWSLQHL
jgi:hypothetical protein